MGPSWHELGGNYLTTRLKSGLNHVGRNVQMYAGQGDSGVGVKMG